LASLVAKGFEAGRRPVAFYPAMHAAPSHAQLAGYLADGSTRIDFEQGQDSSIESGIPRQS
jgi:hypothetical protein